MGPNWEGVSEETHPHLKAEETGLFQLYGGLYYSFIFIYHFSL